MKILITGGAGYAGLSLTALLDAKENVSEIIIIDNLSSASDNFFIGTSPFTKVKFINGDILNYDLLANEVKDVDVVYHLASFTNHAFTYAQNIKFEQINQWGTLNLVRAIQEKSENIKKFYYLSSLSVYGLLRNVDIETAEPQPTNAYGNSKFEAEKYVTLLSTICEVGIIRSANIFGFNRCFRKDSVLNNFIFNAILNKKILIYGDGEQSRSFVDVKNVAKELSNLINQSNGKSIFYGHLIDFNATMNKIKDWLLSNVGDLEYTYLNTNIKYDSQFVKGYPSIEEKHQVLNECFLSFYENTSIRAK